jgi:peptidoglycan hydrolase-like protein with peptidoglycan-binding domain
MYSVAPTAAVSAFPPAAGPVLQPVRFGPGQGVASLAVLRRRQNDEQGHGPTPEDDALEISGTTVAVADGEDLVAALRVHAAGTPQLRRELGALLRLERFAGSWSAESIVVGSRLAVLADYRTRPVIDLLMRETYRLARDSGVRFGLVSCAPELHDLFAFYGFREYLPPAILPGGIATLRMALVCEYQPGLQASHSPLLDLVRQPDIGEAAHAWLVQAFPMLG